MEFRAFNAAKSTRMGFRSPLVLAKLGFDLRDHYDDMLSEPLPEELGRLVNLLEERDVPRASSR
jgi:hypothetical protein